MLQSFLRLLSGCSQEPGIETSNTFARESGGWGAIVHQNGCGALWNLASNNNDNQEAIAAGGGI